MKQPVILKSIRELQEVRNKISNQTIGFVPTMGALHDGHAELLKRCRLENEISILSIFVNPTQFNDPKDFELYPKTLKSDVEYASQNEVDYIFLPDQKQMYPDNSGYQLSENLFSKELCGHFRPGHFDGVLTVVMKLFQLVKPTRAYFGEKDFQQLVLIQGMVKAFFLDIEIVPVETVREKSGLAFSSRNQNLNIEEKKLAQQIFQLATHVKSPEEVKMQLTKLGFDVDYVEDKFIVEKKRRFIAAKIGNVRLIDNVEI